ncbi:MAG: AAA family ATPase [Gammaproteobacteria bacterium]
MYLSELKIEGFRRIDDLTVKFRPGLNVLVGANNVGKTAVVDALRALLSTTEEGALRISESDLHAPKGAGTPAAHITFHYVFRGLTVDEEADFLTALKPVAVPAGTAPQYEAHIRVRYSSPDAGGRMRPKRWCGDHEENGLTSDMLEDLRATYLPPLRDPASGLRPSRSSQVARLIHRLSDENAKKEMVDELLKFDTELKKKKPIEETQKAIRSRHEGMLGSKLKQGLAVGFSNPDFQRLAARLSLTVDSLDIEQNGLGYNNLIYMAVVLSELSLNPDAAYKALIVEEPEAHLHPQMQAVLLQYLESKETPEAGEKAVQVFVTSHSPNFAAIARIDTIGCLCEHGDVIKGFFPREVKFAKGKKEKLQRYLDVTRAELYFARRIILVEGAAERFMVEVLAKRMKIDLRKHAVSVLSTEGLNFDAFTPLFGKDSLNVRVAIISDADPQAPGAFPKLGDALSLSDAANAIKALGNDFVKAFFAQKTFEYDLALQPKNQVVMLKALTELHPVIAANLETSVAAALADDKPIAIFKGMFDRGENATNVQKGAYGQALAQTIADDVDGDFVVPPYIADAINYIVAD